jgi:hypothetical protein
MLLRLLASSILFHGCCTVESIICAYVNVTFDYRLIAVVFQKISTLSSCILSTMKPSYKCIQIVNLGEVLWPFLNISHKISSKS